MSEPIKVARTANHLAGVALVGSPHVPEDTLYEINGRLLYHSRLSIRQRRRRPHGRGRPAPRRWKGEVVTYAPMLDRIREAPDA